VRQPDLAEKAASERRSGGPTCPLDLAALWAFACGRGAQEKTFAELKGEFALDVVPTKHYAANSVLYLPRPRESNSLLRREEMGGGARRLRVEARSLPTGTVWG
jgi:hypothetical protein